MKNKITTVLFDLDGTLLPMDQERFAKGYFGRLSARMARHGYDPKGFIDAIWAGTAAMVKNDGNETNETVFFRTFSALTGKNAEADKPYFEDFYRTEFDRVKDDCGFAPEAAQAVKLVKSLGLRVALATNPLFPYMATESRIRWCGLEPCDFELYTSYENSSYCKPNLDYYRSVTERLGVSPEECLMVGNDAIEDTAAEKVGIKVFLLPKYLVNRKNVDISAYPQGDFEDLLRYIDALM